MKGYFNCATPSPSLCKVWNTKEKEFYFAIIIDKTTVSNRYVDHNQALWDCAVPVEVSDCLDLLKGNKQYDYLTVPPQEKDFR